MNNNDFRQLKNNIVKYYELEIVDYTPITFKSYQVITSSNQKYFIKKTNPITLDKYQYLFHQGVKNVYYPIENIDKKFITVLKDDSFFVNEYIEPINLRKDVQVYNFFYSLRELHTNTEIKKTLTPSKSRAKIDELTKQLDYKFRMIEQYVRKLENKPINMFSLPILENYHYILDLKKELIKLQKRIIGSVKRNESVNYSFIHNNPSVDHLVNIKGINYLTSLDHGKIGISSLDLAKFYIMNENSDINFPELLVKEYFDENNKFYYDYFRYLVLVILIKKLYLTNDEYINSSTFIKISESINNYFKNFSDLIDK